MHSLRFEWDEAKNHANRRKHGISFAQSAAIFRDPLHLWVVERVVEGEERWQTIGLSDDLLLLLAAHTVEEDARAHWFASSLQGTPLRAKGESMKTKTFSCTLDSLPLPRAERRATPRVPARKIDTTDIPELTEQQWKGGRRGLLRGPAQQQIRALVDADVVAWLKANGKGYQERLNAILRREMLAQMKR